MRNTFKILFAVLIISFFIIRPVLSYADWNGHDGHSNNGGHSHDSGHHDGGHHDHGYIGVNLSVWPDNYYYGATYYPPDDDVLVSPPIYQVVEPQQSPLIVAAETPSVEDTDNFTINIPNAKGGFTAVTLKKSGNGYIGPQGEFYPEFPKVSQLKVIYGK